MRTARLLKQQGSREPGGTSITITGTNLAGASVSFGSSAATIITDTATQITVTSPPGTGT